MLKNRTKLSSVLFLESLTSRRQSFQDGRSLSAHLCRQRRLVPGGASVASGRERYAAGKGARSVQASVPFWKVRERTIKPSFVAITYVGPRAKICTCSYLWIFQKDFPCDVSVEFSVVSPPWSPPRTKRLFTLKAVTQAFTMTKGPPDNHKWHVEIQQNCCIPSAQRGYYSIINCS